MTTANGIDALDHALEQIDFSVKDVPVLSVSDFAAKISEATRAAENPSTPVTLANVIKMAGKVARQRWARSR
jgi:hypothetical protein